MIRIFLFSIRSNIRLFYIVISIILIILFMTSMLGNAIGNIIESGVYAIEKVAVVNDLELVYKEQLNNLLDKDEIQKVMDIDYYDNIDDVDVLIKDGTYHTVLIANIEDEKNYLKINTVYPESFLISLTNSFAQTANTIEMVIEKAPQQLENIQNSNEISVLETIQSPKGSPDGIDYYGVQTTLQMASLLCLISIYTVLDDRTKNIFPRISIIPISKSKVIAARLVADVIFICIVLVIIAVCSMLVLGVNWTGNIIVILVVFTVYALIVSLLGMISAKITNSVIGALGISMGFGNVIWPRLSGAFSPYQHMGALSIISPSYHAKNVLFATIYSDSWNVITEGLLGMGIIALIMLSIYIVLERRSAT